MDRVSDRLWIGDAADGRNGDEIARNGITAVLNATAVSDAQAGQPVRYLRLNQDDGIAIPPGTLDLARDFLVRSVMAEGRTVLVHCAAGISRASTLCIFWLMLTGWSWDEAERLVRRARPKIEPNPALRHSVLAYFGKGD